MRHFLIIVALGFLFPPSVRGAEGTASENLLIPENEPLWTESMLWDEKLSLSSGLGYKDNVLLSAFHPQGSGFFVNGLDFMIVRAPLDGWQVVGSLIGDDIRYWRNVGPGSEDSFISSLRIQRDLAGGWQASLEARGLYENQVLDISTSQGVPATALVKGYGITAQPSVRKDLQSGVWLQVAIPVTRWFFESPLDDYWETGPVASAGYEFGQRSDLSLSYGGSYQSHDKWVALNAFGRPLSPLLVIWQQRAEIAWHAYWDEHHRWRSSTRLIFAYREDNGGGYFNYYQYQVIEELRWHTADWEIKGSAQFAYEDYPVQGTGILNGQTLYRKLLDFSLGVERRLFKHWKACAKLEYQDVLSNEGGHAGNYTAMTVTGGLRWDL